MAADDVRSRPGAARLSARGTCGRGPTVCDGCHGAAEVLEHGQICSTKWQVPATRASAGARALHPGLSTGLSPHSVEWRFSGL
jgi:hypothetical protein